MVAFLHAESMTMQRLTQDKKNSYAEGVTWKRDRGTQIRNPRERNFTSFPAIGAIVSCRVRELKRP